MPNSIDPQVQTMIDNMPEKTGKALEEWFDILAAAGLEKHGAMMKLLKGDYSVTHGFANTIVLLFRERASGGPPAEEDLISTQYTGPKAALYPIYQAVLAAAQACGPEVEIAPKKTYVSLRRSKQFAIVQASTRTRVDLGLNLKGEAPPDRLEGGKVFGGMCTHRIKLTSPEEVDDQVREWLKKAYDLA